MNCKLESKEVQEIDSCNIVQQTSFWASVKNQQGIDPVAFNYTATDDLLHANSSSAKHTKGDLLVLLRYVDNFHCIAYVPYGPKDEPDFEHQGPFLEELSEVLRPHLPVNCIMIRYDLPWENQWAAEEDYFDTAGNWIGPPAFNNQNFRVNFNTRNWNLHKSYSDNLPSNTIFLDLDQSPEVLMQKMKPKTRYNIRLSHRKGIKVTNHGMEMLDRWYALYRETTLRNSVTLHSRDYFQSVLRSRYENNSADVDVRLLMAALDGEYLAAMFLVRSHKRGSYLYGASSERNRNAMATYALQWEAIRLARESGCREYDMFGVPPNPNPSHPMHGLYRFKSGFGGQLFHRMGCWDYPLMEPEYQTYIAQEVNGQKYHVH
ncbi:MAG: peptidoglycan bridge formation glycyltransferase FemA/FemB family protein [Bacteroidales bacterium]